MSDYLINTKPIIMVVDDTPANLRLLAQMLSQSGFDVRVANSGLAALRSARAITPDLILLDIMMPEMDGYKTCQELKADERTRDIPVIFISALDQVDAKIYGFSMGGADYVTKPFQVEEVLARVKTHLALRTLQRRLERANQKLQQQVEELQRQNDELDAFAHTVAHDLKNPLNNVIGYTELLLHHARMDTQTQENLLEWIRDAGLRMNEIIESLLLLAGVRKQDVVADFLEMEPLITDVLQQLKPQIDECEAQIELPEIWPAARGYAQWVEQVWVNYLSNALKYGGKPPRVVLSAHLQEGERMVRFEVSDNGPGLDQAEIAQLFRPFARLHKERASGHGLGLTIVERIVSKLGGTAGVESTPGEGCTFYFTLPVAGNQ